VNQIEVVGLGALNMDHLYQVESIVGDGETVEHVEHIPKYIEAEAKCVGIFMHKKVLQYRYICHNGKYGLREGV
jgi:hypothetical protein